MSDRLRIVMVRSVTAVVFVLASPAWLTALIVVPISFGVAVAIARDPTQVRFAVPALVELFAPPQADAPPVSEVNDDQPVLPVRSA